MTEDLILVVDYEKICRLCLHATGAMSDLFEENEKPTLKELVLQCTGLKVEKHDGFPTKICHRCRYIVELSCELREMVARTNSLLVSAASHLEAVDEQPDKTPEIPIPVPETKNKHSRKEKPDLRLIMQEDGVMTLIKPDPGTPVEDRAVNWDEEIVGLKIEDAAKEIKVTSKSRNSTPKHLTCEICLATFPTAEDVTLHVPVHYEDSSLTPYVKLKRPYKCEMCKKTVTKVQLIRHHRSHLNINPFVCKHAGCGFLGKNQDALRRHGLSHAARLQVCERCGAAFRRGGELRAHTSRAHGPQPAACRVCRARFRNALSLRAHLRHCRQPRRHKCDWPGCPKAYHAASSLAVHKRTHSNERLYRCQLCKTAAYKSQSLLNRHLRMHSRARLSKCDKCSATFDDYGAFYRHRVAEHGRWMRYRCAGCDKRYQTEGKLEKHLEECEQAIAMRTLDGACAAQADSKAEQLLVSSIQEIIDFENKTLQVEGDITEDLLDKFRGQSLLVQPGNISDLSKDMELQDLPPDGLLYIEVDPEAEDDPNDAWQQ